MSDVNKIIEAIAKDIWKYEDVYTSELIRLWNDYNSQTRAQGVQWHPTAFEQQRNAYNEAQQRQQQHMQAHLDLLNNINTQSAYRRFTNE